MKKTFAILTLLAAFSAGPILAADSNNPPAASAAERLAQADLSAAVKQYESVRALEHEAALELSLLKAGAREAATERQMDMISTRLGVLREQAEQLRKDALDYGQEIAAHSKIAAAKAN